MIENGSRFCNRRFLECSFSVCTCLHCLFHDGSFENGHDMGGGSNSSIRVVCSLQPIKDSCSGVGLVKVHHRAPPTHPTCCWHKALTTITITYCSRPCFFSGSTASGHYRGGPSREHSGFPPPQSGSLGKFIAVALNKLWD